MDRRTFTAAVVFAPVTSTVAAASPQTVDPVLPLIVKWEEAEEVFLNLSSAGADDGVCNIANDLISAIAFELAETPPTTPQGLARYLDFVRKHFNTSEYSGWADNIDLKAADTAVAAAFAIAGMEG